MKPFKTDFKNILDNEIFPKLDRRLAVRDLDPEDHGAYYVVTCPECQQHEAYVYKNGFHIECNRKDKCGHRVSLIAHVAGTPAPRGKDFIETLSKFADMVGISLPERTWKEGDVTESEKSANRRGVLDIVVKHCEATLWSQRGDDARRYLMEERGISEAHMKTLGLGFYASASSCRSALLKAGFAEDDFGDLGVVWPTLEGYMIFPWHDDHHQPLTLYGRFPMKTPPLMKDHPGWSRKREKEWADWEAQTGEEKNGNPWKEPTILKTLAIRGDRTKRSPLYFDRARAAGHQDTVLVEGVMDAALLQVLGDTRVIACVGAQLSAEQVETLQRHRIKSVTICLDPDQAGERGLLSCIKSLDGTGIKAYVAPTLPEGLDPDEFVLKFGIDGWRDHISKAIHGFRYMAQVFIKKHVTTSGWTDKTVEALMDEASLFDAKNREARRRTELLTHFWPEIFSGSPITEKSLEERLELARKVEQESEDDRQKREITSLVESVQTCLNDGRPERAISVMRTFVEYHPDQVEVATPDDPDAPTVADSIQTHEARISKYRGAEFIGLPQRTLPALDIATLGLRQLMLLAAPPNVGKTVLATQFGLDILLNNPDACFVFVSLEMTQWDIMARLLCKLAGLPWHTLMFGSQKGTGVRPSYFTPDELQRLESAERQLADLGRRFIIMDDRHCPEPTVSKIMEQVEALKKRSGSRRAYVSVDYLQVWPVPHEELRHAHSEIEVDKMRIGAMKDLRNAMDGDPVLVISEARKPTDKEGVWGGKLSDVMGSARASYTPDIVFLLQPFSDNRLYEFWEEPPFSNTPAQVERVKQIKVELVQQGYSLNSLQIVKGRDGVDRKSFDLRFWFKESRFEEVVSNA